MACGVPCVVTDVGDSGYIVADTGLAVPARDHGALARAIRELIEAGQARRRQLGEAARRRVENEFSLPAIVRRYEDLYQEHLGRLEKSL
jgi:glycosyltransferase involved in cell wall biosynthesis